MVEDCKESRLSGACTGCTPSFLPLPPGLSLTQGEHKRRKKSYASSKSV